MLARTASLSRRSGAPAHGSLSKAAAPVRSPVTARVKRASQAPHTTAAPARSAALPRAAVRGNRSSRSRSCDSCGLAPGDAVSFLKANQQGVYHHALLIIDNKVLESGDKNIPPKLIGCFFDMDACAVEGSSAKRLSVKRGPNMRMVSENKMLIPVIAYVECGGSVVLVEGVDKITGWVRKNGKNLEFRGHGLKQCLKRVGAKPGDRLLVSMRLQGDQLVMELRLLRKEAVTEEVLAAMKRFLVPRKPWGQKVTKVAVTAAGPKPAAAPAAACDQQQRPQRPQQAEAEAEANEGAKPTAAPAPAAAAEAIAGPPAPSASTVNIFYGPVYITGSTYNDRSNINKE